MTVTQGVSAVGVAGGTDGYKSQDAEAFGRWKFNKNRVTSVTDGRTDRVNCASVYRACRMLSPWRGKMNYTVSQESFRFKLFVTLPNLNWFSTFFALLKSAWNLLQNPYDTTHVTLGILLHSLGKLKIQLFADIQQIWKKTQTNCTCAPILIPLRV